MVSFSSFHPRPFPSSLTDKVKPSLNSREHLQTNSAVILSIIQSVASEQNVSALGGTVVYKHGASQGSCIITTRHTQLCRKYHTLLVKNASQYATFF